MSETCQDVNLYFRKITDTNGDVISERTMDFPDLADLDVEYTYDRNGNMTGDANNRLECAYYNPGGLSFTRAATGRSLSQVVQPNKQSRTIWLHYSRNSLNIS